MIRPYLISVTLLHDPGLGLALQTLAEFYVYMCLNIIMAYFWNRVIWSESESIYWIRNNRERHRQTDRQTDIERERETEERSDEQLPKRFIYKNSLQLMSKGQPVRGWVPARCRAVLLPKKLFLMLFLMAKTMCKEYAVPNA